MDPPPRPPPHGNNNGNGRGGLPDGNYDIFIIPPHSSGSGFLYLPSLQPHRNSFLAGVGVTLLAVAVWMIVFPVLREWLSTIVASGGMGVVILMVGMGVAGWAWGKTQMEGGGSEGGGSAGASNKGQHMPGSPPPTGAPPPSSSEPPPRPKPTWTRSTPAPGAGAANTSAKTAWEKAREETRKKEEERKKTEEARKKREDEEKERVRQREREAREREIRELREAREKREREAKAAQQRSSRPSSPTKGRHQQPSAHTEPDEDAYSFRPYDKPKVSPSKSSGTGSIYSSSYAASQSTARSTPPPSHRGPYHTKDPDKIVLKAVYSFNNTFMKLPIAQLVSGVKPVTDGLILRITTEGLFIDDDVRGVPQREWDVKAWTMKLVEVRSFLFYVPFLLPFLLSSALRPAFLFPASRALLIAWR